MKYPIFFYPSIYQDLNSYSPSDPNRLLLFATSMYGTSLNYSPTVIYTQASMGHSVYRRLDGGSSLACIDSLDGGLNFKCMLLRRGEWGGVS